MRKNALATGEIYHVFTRSIADYVVFNNDSEFEHMRQLIKYFKTENDVKFSDFLELKIVSQEGFNNACDIIHKDKEKLVQIIAYCFMPTHIHLVLKQLKENGISKYMKDILISYTRFFNTQHKRKGPLWEGRFKSVLVESDEQLLHLTRYIHLNPVTAKLINKPQNWRYSSYSEYLGEVTDNSTICQFDNLLEIKSKSYSKFVNDQISYQRELAKIKKMLLE
ncbi:hypothetical protein A2V71_02455 [Candidatus Berkelbacteria bacterium RBG_13_40_8]|uniref:Transposase IS200-like domain-containing protein n=1 Tax=Candidatus Berkelbacteria bacterium RBG_13_40_8 TaxID=1797467 RepID=A0A1F5DN84_9BACT|nr:MAG: hypothetical protein A2V71_02455 [Candidatus Berkelbacteria bacterium RBG_13_40_8]